jgi:hypothetical protein
MIASILLATWQVIYVTANLSRFVVNNSLCFTEDLRGAVPARRPHEILDELRYAKVRRIKRRLIRSLRESSHSCDKVVAPGEQQLPGSQQNDNECGTLLQKGRPVSSLQRSSMIKDLTLTLPLDLGVTMAKAQHCVPEIDISCASISRASALCSADQTLAGLNA